MSFIEVFLLSCLVLFSFYRLKFLMLFFQQEEYDNVRFIKYAFRRFKLIDKKLSFIILILFPVMLLWKYASLLLLVLFVLFGIKESRALQKAKKKLVITNRVKLIFLVSFVLIGLELYFLRFLPFLWESFLIIQSLPFILPLANMLLFPLRKYREAQFISSAKAKLQEVNPTIIGITGSYGKTSVKHILGHLLSSFENTLWTKGSINTVLGICSVLNRELNASHKYFISEMGAYKKGSIARLCKLTPPTNGIITAIGTAHYERFKTEQSVAEAKFEMADFVEKKGGKLICNLTQINPKYIPEKPFIVPVGAGGKYAFDSIQQTKEGLSFLFKEEGSAPVLIKAPLFGTHHASNIALCLALLREMGYPISTLKAALHNLPQITHRLEVKKQGDITLIDDAYNSNPTGFKSALETLNLLKTTRSILVTPGMVELGKIHQKAHLEVGREAGKTADIVLAVLPSRIPSFCQGVLEGNHAKLIQVASFKEAYAWLEAHQQAGDVVLYENDLPDIYENKVSL
ncbi:MAG: UDP-N-acetylmuramoyl-tripeptide--D-alanyl-D-alanine ligase [Alphaproteobacteria bacterium]|nr:UDP-N-acetylmuramoyl-tripeptide--D-alanyl-D-alanine ligase [Alphaproteobacteria bacterium]